MKESKMPDEISLQLSNVAKTHEEGKRVIGFVINSSELESQAYFSELLEQYCNMFLQTRGYKVEKRKRNAFHTTENHVKKEVSLGC